MNRYIQYMYSYPHKTAYRELENVNIKDYMPELSGDGHSLYVHIPFCESKCGYCNLFSVTGCENDFFEKYVDAVINQIKQYSRLIPQDTMFDEIVVGGGTPLILKDEQLKNIFDAIYKYMPVKRNCEIIIETAPAQTTPEKIRLLKELNVTRVSMGVQSFHEDELKWLKRSHMPEQAKNAAELLKNAKFECMNLDFIYGIPFQTRESLINSLEQALEFSPDEIFMYPLYIKHGVKLLEEKSVPDPEHTYELYKAGSEFLIKHGFTQKSMRRFTLKNDMNFSECGMKSCLSLGCGGRSYLGKLHACTPYRITRCQALSELKTFINTVDYTVVTNGIILSEDEIKRRYVIKHGFMLPGISQKAYSDRFNNQVLSEFPVFSKWINEGYFTADNDCISITSKGMELSDMLGPMLISDEINEKMSVWENSN